MVFDFLIEGEKEVVMTHGNTVGQKVNRTEKIILRVQRPAFESPCAYAFGILSIGG